MIEFNGYSFDVDVELDAQSDESGAPFYFGNCQYKVANFKVLPPEEVDDENSPVDLTATGDTEDDVVSDLESQLYKAQEHLDGEASLASANSRNDLGEEFQAYTKCLAVVEVPYPESEEEEDRFEEKRKEIEQQLGQGILEHLGQDANPLLTKLKKESGEEGLVRQVFEFEPTELCLFLWRGSRIQRLSELTQREFKAVQDLFVAEIERRSASR